MMTVRDSESEKLQLQLELQIQQLLFRPFQRQLQRQGFLIWKFSSFPAAFAASCAISHHWGHQAGAIRVAGSIELLEAVGM